jgi:hypothetical protein
MDTDDAEWADRITFRHGAPGEIILRVPREDANGDKAATNHVLTVGQAFILRDELCEALWGNEVEDNTKDEVTK